MKLSASQQKAILNSDSNGALRSVPISTLKSMVKKGLCELQGKRHVLTATGLSEKNKLEMEDGQIIDILRTVSKLHSELETILKRIEPHVQAARERRLISFTVSVLPTLTREGSELLAKAEKE